MRLFHLSAYNRKASFGADSPRELIGGLLENAAWLARTMKRHGVYPIPVSLTYHRTPDEHDFRSEEVLAYLPPLFGGKPPSDEFCDWCDEHAAEWMDRAAKGGSVIDVHDSQAIPF